MCVLPHPPLNDRLRDTLRDHDEDRRRHGQGVTGAALDADAALWLALGGAVATLAGQIREACRLSAFSSHRPDAQVLAARMSESIDDQLDLTAWRIVDAAARLKATSTP